MHPSDNRDTKDDSFAKRAGFGHGNLGNSALAFISEDGDMNAEVTAQLLDALAFLLVTPEFLGEQTLDSIQRSLNKTSQFLFAKVLPFMKSEYYPAVVIPIIILTILGGLGVITGVAFLLLPFLVLLSIGIFTSLVFILSCVISFAARLAIRRILFSVGVVLFLVARAISVWHAWGRIEDKRIEDNRSPLSYMLWSQEVVIGLRTSYKVHSGKGVQDFLKSPATDRV